MTRKATIGNMMTAKEWLAWVSKNSSFSEIGEVASVSKSTLSRRAKDGTKLSAEDVIKISEAYGVDPVQALRDTGHLPQRPQEENPEQLAERIKADVDRLASKLNDSNVIPFPAEPTPNVSTDFYSVQHEYVANTDDEDAERGWDGDID